MRASVTANELTKSRNLPPAVRFIVPFFWCEPGEDVVVEDERAGHDAPDREVGARLVERQPRVPGVRHVGGKTNG